MNQMISDATRLVCTDTGRIGIEDPVAFLSRVAAYCETYDLPFEGTRSERLTITTEIGAIDMRASRDGLSVDLAAPNDGALHMLRETVATQLDLLDPARVSMLGWHGDIAPGRFPPNFRLATVLSVTALGRSFWRLEVGGDDLTPFAHGGLHLRLALPTRGASAAWPILNQRGRTEWPSPDDLHVAVYTVRSIDPVTSRTVIDIFRHAGGRTCDWISAARSGEEIGMIGPGGGWYPDADHLVIAGDETALPAIARILDHAAPDTTGTAIVEVNGAFDYPPLTVPPGMTLRILDRSQGSDLETALAEADLGADGARHVWFAAEKSRAAAVRHDLRARRGVARSESYVTGYWQKG